MTHVVSNEPGLPDKRGFRSDQACTFSFAVTSLSLEGVWVASDMERNAWNWVEGSGRIVIGAGVRCLSSSRSLGPSLRHQLSISTPVSVDPAASMIMQGAIHGSLKRAAPTERWKLITTTSNVSCATVSTTAHLPFASWSMVLSYAPSCQISGGESKAF